MKITFSYLVTTFFVSFLRDERGLSKNTIASYSDCMKLLVLHVCDHFGIQPEAIDIQMINHERILAFLDSIENERKNCPATRNQRLAAIKTFFHFLARNVPELMEQNELIQRINFKKTDHRPPPSLTIEEVASIVSEPDSTTLLGSRDQALLQLMYNTGARVQELADLRVSDIYFDGQSSVTLTGKGRKTRVLPLWEITLDLIKDYLKNRKNLGIESDHLFLNKNGIPITRFGIGRMVAKYAENAAEKMPSLRDRKISPHVFRHTTALHLIEANVDIDIVKDWLGHADIKTTSLYVEVSIERKRKALEKMPSIHGDQIPETPKWKQSDILELLSKCSQKAHYVA